MSNVVFKYAAKGVRQVERADKKLRRQVKQTGRVAKRESRNITQWFNQNKQALAAIGVAAVGVMAAIVRASPRFNATMDTIRFGFSLIADEIAFALEPALTALEEGVLDASEAFADFPAPVKAATGAILIITAVVGGFSVAVAGLQKLIAGTVIATIGAKLVAAVQAASAAIAGSTSATLALAAAAGTLIGLLTTWILETTGVFDAVENLAGSLRDSLSPSMQTVVDVGQRIAFGILPAIGAAVVSLVRGDLDQLVNRTKAQLQAWLDAWKVAINNSFIPIINGLIGAWNRLAEHLPGTPEIDKVEKLAIETQFAGQSADQTAEAYDGVRKSVQGVESGLRGALNVAKELEETGRSVENVLDPRPDQFEPAHQSISQSRVRQALQALRGSRFPRAHVDQANIPRITELLKDAAQGRSLESIMQDARGEAFVGAFFGPTSDTEAILRQLGIPGFATGGVVPGPRGQAQAAVVHGGEVVLTPRQAQALGGGGQTVVEEGAVQVIIHGGEGLDEEDVGRIVADRLDETLGGRGF